MENIFTKLELFELMKECPKHLLNEKFEYMENRLADITGCSESERNVLKQSLKWFKHYFKEKWSSANRMEDRFIQNNSDWLASTISVPLFSLTIPGPGRPKKDFNVSSERSKRRKTEDLRMQSTSEELMFAASMSQRAGGYCDSADLVKKITENPTKATEFKKKITTVDNIKVNKHSPEEALAIFVEAELTKNQYEILHNSNKNIYPCYSSIKKAKKECYPSENSIIVSETLAEVKLQSLLDHSVSRLCKYLEEVLYVIDFEETQNLELIWKWGCDGSQQSQFKQKFTDENNDDANIFQSSCVPIKLIANVNERKKTIWQNPTPSSTRFCRPIRMRFIHETTDVTIEEIKLIEDQIKLLNITEVPLNDTIIKIKHTMLLTMVDGKVCNAATGTSSTMKCYICGFTSKDFNNLDKKFTENPDNLKFGLSTLHARIRFFESLLHLSYKIPIRKWQARSAEEKKLVADTKKNIQQKFRTELGLIVDVPKQGFGTTNDGNTARRFFADPEISARITGVNVELIKRFKVILETITSGYHIHENKFKTYANETAKLYVKLYNWHPMTPTIHKILIHGATVIKSAIIPIGQLSEEAAEARNKHFRLYRTNYSRKFSREVSNRDVLNRLLLTSDPFISCSKRRSRKMSKPFTTETLQLLLPEMPDGGPSNVNQADSEDDAEIIEEVYNISEESD